jgi:hypothetical protein
MLAHRCMVPPQSYDPHNLPVSVVRLCSTIVWDYYTQTGCEVYKTEGSGIYYVQAKAKHVVAF